MHNTGLLWFMVGAFVGALTLIGIQLYVLAGPLAKLTGQSRWQVFKDMFEPMEFGSQDDNKNEQSD